LFFTHWKLACFHDKVIKIKSLEKNAENSSLRSSYLPSARFGPSERFALSTVPELFREVPKRSVPSRAEPMQSAGFHLFPFSFTSADCAVPSRAEPIRSDPIQ
jgi:hypothetical protein